MAKELSVQVLIGRNAEIWEKHTVLGYTQKELADEYDLSRQRIGQILIEWAGTLEDLPRDVMARARMDQVDAKISSLEERQSECDANHAMYIAYSAEIRKWFDYRSRLLGEYAPTNVRIDTNEATENYINGVNVKDLK